MAQDRYAELLVEKLPPKYRLEVFHELFRQRTEADGTKLRAYIKALLKSMDEEERAEIVRTSSAELTRATDAAAIRSVIQILGPDIWSTIEELPRIRIEAKLMEEIERGRFNASRGRCEAGSLGTWVQTITNDFARKKELGWLIIQKIESDVSSEREYVFQYLFHLLDQLFEKPPSRLEKRLIKWLSEGDVRTKEIIDTTYFDWTTEGWSEQLEAAIREFKPDEPVSNPFDNDDDDLPF